MAFSNNSVIWKEDFTIRTDPREAKRDFQLFRKICFKSGYRFARKREEHGKKEV